jgi:hypothetical protein
LPASPAPRNQTPPPPRVVAASILIAGCIAGLIVYVFRPEVSPTLTHELAWAGTERSANPSPSETRILETTQAAARYLESAPPLARAQLGARKTDAGTAERPDLSHYLDGYRYADEIRAFLSRDADAAPAGLAALQQGGDAAIEEMGQLLQALPSSYFQEQQLAADFLLARARALPDSAAKVRQVFAELSTRPDPPQNGEPRIGAAQAFWMYLQTSPPDEERQGVWQTAWNAQSEAHSRESLEQMGALMRTPAAAAPAPQENPPQEP